jgi:hypothetical protein
MEMKLNELQVKNNSGYLLVERIGMAIRRRRFLLL